MITKSLDIVEENCTLDLRTYYRPLICHRDRISWLQLLIIHSQGQVCDVHSGVNCYESSFIMSSAFCLTSLVTLACKTDSFASRLILVPIKL